MGVPQINSHNKYHWNYLNNVINHNDLDDYIVIKAINLVNRGHLCLCCLVY